MVVQATGQSYERHLMAGGQFLREAKVEEACREFEAALEVRPGDPKALGLLGLVHFRRNAFQDARPVYEKLVEVRPQDASFRLNLGLVYLKLGEASRAIEQLAESRKLDPSQTRTMTYLGLAYARAGEYGQAYRAFLSSGQTELAAEMAQHLDSDQLADIDASLSSPGQSEEPASPSQSPEAGGSGESVSGFVQALEEHSNAGPLPQPPTPAPAPAPAPVASSAGEISGPSHVRRSGMISQMVRIAMPSTAAEAAVSRMALGHTGPMLLGQYAIDKLLRSPEGDTPFALGNDGMLVLRVANQVLSRMTGVIASAGSLSYAPVARRVRGANTNDSFGGEEDPLFLVSGSGYIVASPGEAEFCVLRLMREDVLYMLEEHVYAFEEGIHWENGSVPGSDGRMRVVNFRGEGVISLRSTRPFTSLKLTGDESVFVDAHALAGWIGRVVPRMMQASDEAEAAFVECGGEGFVLLRDDRPISRS